jgi:hypothetical protein
MCHRLSHGLVVCGKRRAAPIKAGWCNNRSGSSTPTDSLVCTARESPHLRIQSPTDLSPAEIAYQKKVAAWAQVETAYARLQSLPPETLAPALADSPIGLASWFIEKFKRWGTAPRALTRRLAEMPCWTTYRCIGLRGPAQLPSGSTVSRRLIRVCPGGLRFRPRS